MKEKVIRILNELSKELDDLYGYVSVEGENFGEPAINSGPCAAFANAFYKSWNSKFKVKVWIVFVMVRNSTECWHTLIRLPNRLLYDGGVGVHSEAKYTDKFDIEEMRNYDVKLLDERAYGLDRTFPRYCPDFSISVVTSIIEKHLSKIAQDDL